MDTSPRSSTGGEIDTPSLPGVNIWILFGSQRRGSGSEACVYSGIPPCMLYHRLPACASTSQISEASSIPTRHFSGARFCAYSRAVPDSQDNNGPAPSPVLPAADLKKKRGLATIPGARRLAPGKPDSASLRARTNRCKSHHKESSNRRADHPSGTGNNSTLRLYHPT